MRVLDTLTHSHQYHDREAAAIYLGHLLRTRREPASRLLRELLHDPDDHIRDTATDTVTAAIHTGTLDANAAELRFPQVKRLLSAVDHKHC